MGPVISCTNIGIDRVDADGSETHHHLPSCGYIVPRPVRELIYGLPSSRPPSALSPEGVLRISEKRLPCCKSQETAAVYRNRTGKKMNRTSYNQHIIRFGAALCTCSQARSTGWSLVGTPRIGMELDRNTPVHVATLMLASARALQEAIESLRRSFREVDILVNNAGSETRPRAPHQANLDGLGCDDQHQHKGADLLHPVRRTCREWSEKSDNVVKTSARLPRNIMEMLRGNQGVRRPVLPVICIPSSGQG